MDSPSSSSSSDDDYGDNVDASLLKRRRRGALSGGISATILSERTSRDSSSACSSDADDALHDVEELDPNTLGYDMPMGFNETAAAAASIAAAAECHDGSLLLNVNHDGSSGVKKTSLVKVGGVTKAERCDVVHLHKSHVLCLFSAARMRSAACNISLVQCALLSAMVGKLPPSSSINDIAGSCSMDVLRMVVYEVVKEFSMHKDTSMQDIIPGSIDMCEEKLLAVISTRRVQSSTMLNLLIVTALRALGVQCRLVSVLHARSPKRSVAEHHAVRAKRTEITLKEISHAIRSAVGNDATTVHRICSSVEYQQQFRKRAFNLACRTHVWPALLTWNTRELDNDIIGVANTHQNSKNCTIATVNPAPAATGAGRSDNTDLVTLNDNDSDFEPLVMRRFESSSVREKEIVSCVNGTRGELSGDIVKVCHDTRSNRKQRSSLLKVNRDRICVETPTQQSITNDDDEMALNVNRKMKRKAGKKSVGMTVKKRKSLDQECSPSNLWAEVYVSKDVGPRWVCVEAASGLIDDVDAVARGSSKPLLYVVAEDASQNVKDVTRRYVGSDWISKVVKQRPDLPWWDSIIGVYDRRNSSTGATGDPSTMDLNEEAEMNEIVGGKDNRTMLPTSIAAMKDHPLFALSRHLLKFQAIRPGAPVLGTIRNENVYSRNDVISLQGRVNWLKEARQVRINEIPFKVVKGRLSKKASDAGSAAPDLELFGLWQTDVFQPLIAQNGRVPVNEFGNVELFKPQMLPIGTVRLQLNGLARIAAKLGIHCVPALIDWEFSKHGTRPLLDGYVVCAEFEVVLREAWAETQRIEKEKAHQKKTADILKRWELFTRGLLVRANLNQQFGTVSSLKQVTRKRKSGTRKKSKGS